MRGLKGNYRMENSKETPIDSYEKAAKTVGAYLGWFNKLLESLNKSIDDAPLKFWKRIAAKGALRKLEKLYYKQDRDFTATIEEVGKLYGVITPEEFEAHCESIRRMVLPLFAKTKHQADIMSKSITLATFAVKRGK